MNKTLKDLKFAMPYLDDIIIFSNSEEEHFKHVETVFQKLQQAKLSMKLSKCHFFATEIAYLGHILSQDGIKPLPSKTIAINNMTPPKTQKQVRAFLGLVGYYRKFIKNFAKIAKPLTLLTKHDTKFKWGLEHQTAFDQLRSHLTSDSILRYPDPTKPYIVYTDASDDACGAQLNQEHNGTEFPVSFLSHTFTEPQRKWSTTEQEAFGIFYAVRKWNFYLQGAKVIVRNDHQPLARFLNGKTQNAKVNRWSLELSTYDITFEWISGAKNKAADCLSRLVEVPPSATTSINVIISRVATRSQHPPHDPDQPVQLQPLHKHHQPQGQLLAQISPPPQKEQTIDQPQPNPQQPTQEQTPLTQETAQELPPDTPQNDNATQNQAQPAPSRDNDTPNDHHTALLELQKSDPFCKRITGRLLSGRAPKHEVDTFLLHDGLLYRQVSENNSNFKALVVPKSYRFTILVEAHDKMSHQGNNRTYHLIKRQYYWKGMSKDIQSYIKNCPLCKRDKQKVQAYPLTMTDIPSRPFDKIALDLVECDLSERGNKWIHNYRSPHRMARSLPSTQQNSRYHRQNLHQRVPPSTHVPTLCTH